MLGALRALLRHRSLVKEMSKREVLGRYRGASFGLIWSLLSPFLLLIVYAFAFGTVMGGRWPAVAAGQTSFAIILFAGLIVHGFFSECINRAPLLVVANPTYVKRVVFPLEILPWPMVVSALFHVLMNTIVFVLLRLAMDGDFTWTVVLLPIVMLPLVLMMVGVAWFLASLGVYLRDVTQVTGVLSMAFLFVSTAMMPLESVPVEYRWVFEANPLSFFIDQARDVLLWGRSPDWAGLALRTAIGALLMFLGRRWFLATKRGFPDVL